MDIIRFPCPRCGKHLQVPGHKAGHHGRCPTCGGRIRVPDEEGVEHVAGEEAHHHGWAIAAVVCVGLLLVLVVVVALSGGKQGGPEPTSVSDSTGAAVNAELKRVREKLVQVYHLEDRLKAYRELVMSEKRLHARDVRTRLNKYERVSSYECSLRREILALWDARAQAAAEAGVVIRDDWQLNTPLTTLEKEDYVLLSKKLDDQSSDFSSALRSARIRIRPQKDPLGRRLLDSDRVEKRIAAELKRLRKLEADAIAKLRG